MIEQIFEDENCQHSNLKNISVVVNKSFKIILLKIREKFSSWSFRKFRVILNFFKREDKIDVNHVNIYNRDFRFTSMSL